MGKYDTRIPEVYENLGKWLNERKVSMVMKDCATEEEVINKAQEADIYLAYKFRVSRRIIESLPNLCLIMASGSGYDHIDVPAATEKGIIVTNSGSYNVEDVAEHALTMIMYLSRKMRFFERSVKEGLWEVGALAMPVTRLQGKCLGIIGYGKIGRALAKRAICLGMKVLAHDPNIPKKEMVNDGLDCRSFEQVLEQADFVSLHLRLDPQTRHLIGEKELRSMKPTSYLINTSRGAVVREDMLLRAIKDGWIAGAGLDVLEHEPPPPDHPLFDLENVMVTGHSAGTTVESVTNWQNGWRKVIQNYLDGFWPPNVVNAPEHPKVSLQRK
jgi:D-3-phosphoglycerate dehydrogenase